MRWHNRTEIPRNSRKERRRRYERRRNSGGGRSNYWVVAIVCAVVVALISFGLYWLCGKDCGKETKAVETELGMNPSTSEERYLREEKTNEKHANVLPADSSFVQKQEKIESKSSDKEKAEVHEEVMEMPGRISGMPEVLLHKPNFIVSYNTKTYCPNYVAWHLTKERVNGEYARSNKFHSDEDIEYRYQVEPSDYSGSGYDRGHMCPAADNKDTWENMVRSFCMTNVCPQNHNLNSGDWNDLEEKCREWVREKGDIYIVCGPIFDSETPETIGKDDRMRISVPDRFFKVVLYQGKNTEAIGFIMPNMSGKNKLVKYAITVDEVESETGIDFFPSLPDDVENECESQLNLTFWKLGQSG